MNARFLTPRFLSVVLVSLAAPLAFAACSSSSDSTNSAAPGGPTGAGGSGGGTATGGNAGTMSQSGTSGAAGSGAVSGGPGVGGTGGTGGSDAAGGTSGGAGSGGSAGGTDMSPPGWNKMVTPEPDSQAAMDRTACKFKGPDPSDPTSVGALPAETLGDQVKLGDQIPIDHIVLVMMENRSFDHMFQKLPANGQSDADVAPDSYTNTHGAGPVSLHSIGDGAYCLADLDHDWSSVHAQVNGGKMDGFAMSNDDSGDGARALTYQTPDTMPFGYFMAESFGIGDRYFCSLQGPTWPNRMYFYAATSFGLTANTLSTPATTTTLFDNLTTRGIDWRVYKTDTPGAGMFISLVLDNKTKFKPLAQFATDAAAGNLPPVTYVDPSLMGKEAIQSSQHPPANHEYGEEFLWDVVNAVTTSPLWAHTALFITYDEHGGFYDHVPPPSACKPDSYEPSEGANLGSFDQLGVRVPVYVISPYAKAKYVSHTVHDHTSIVRFIENRFTLPALTNRDANADSMSDFFDFDSPPDTTPPTLPARPGITAAQDAQCAQLFPN